ncbi:hypothetical protein PF005_g29672 [Phytophthora fragariae]|uniref:Uncharacterized protein n=1 Tax=Phytophthora fragariae TaxID=53985 RepID=A0A6A3DNI3_9STRA|nr:hypothetical protein PF003_g3526 [Phytophthora fragariae]KAE8919568.1 hypothetical protein PF009_g30128 [Phytophthora fragariae]KAE9063708.1 hypothetical protein PF007_g29460 [Phytophthora fragariae]KAE9070681.1 hypothetical protein PF006_g29310 [Phytophthora fragariae]KAE9165298.1 hypothetical protein PF005_g29672 [Phytophthora fragariae]
MATQLPICSRTAAGALRSRWLFLLEFASITLTLRWLRSSSTFRPELGRFISSYWESAAVSDACGRNHRRAGSSSKIHSSLSARNLPSRSPDSTDQDTRSNSFIVCHGVRPL